MDGLFAHWLLVTGVDCLFVYLKVCSASLAFVSGWIGSLANNSAITISENFYMQITIVENRGIYMYVYIYMFIYIYICL